MAYYRLLNTATGERLQLNVGEFYSRDTIALGINSNIGDFPAYPTWDFTAATVTPVLRSTGDRFLDVKPFEYWELYADNVIVFESDIRYSLKIILHEDEGTIKDASSYARKWIARRLKFEIWTAGKRTVDLGYTGDLLESPDNNQKFCPLGLFQNQSQYNASIMYDIYTKTFSWAGINTAKYAFDFKSASNFYDVPVVFTENDKIKAIERTNLQDYRRFPQVKKNVSNVVVQTPPPWKFESDSYILPAYNTSMYLINGYGVLYDDKDAQIPNSRQNRILYYLLFNDSWNPYDNDDNDGNNDDSGDSPSGGNGKQNPTTDDINIPSMPNVNFLSTGFINLYYMTESKLNQFSNELWNLNVFNTFIKLFSNPMDAVLFLRAYPFYVSTSETSNIQMGNVALGVEANKIPQVIYDFDFGTIHVDGFYNDYSDYDAASILYLPYIGYRQIDTNDIMDADINVYYRVDLLSKSCVAYVKVQKNIDGTQLNSILQSYEGSIGYDVPVSSVDASNIIQTTVSMLQGQVSSAFSQQTKIEHAGTLGSNLGTCSIQQPYLILTRPIHSLASRYSHFIGFPYHGYNKLGSVYGYTKCQAVFIDNVIGTVEETEMIKELLLSGVIL